MAPPRIRRSRSRRTASRLLAAACALALTACCPAPAATGVGTDVRTGVLVGIVGDAVGSGDAVRTLITDERGVRYAVIPPLTATVGSVVYLRGRFDGGVFVVDEAAVLSDP